MSERGSPKSSPYRYSSPTSSLTPLSQSTFPQWIRHSRPRYGIVFNGRLKVTLIALACMLMGWMLTSTLGPNGSDLGEFDDMYDTASGGVLEDPTGFGAHSARPKSQPGIIGGIVPDEELNEDFRKEEQPSVSNALAELHDAVKGKIQSWNPYFVKPSESDSVGNSTTKGKYKPANATANAGLLGGEDIKDGFSEAERLGARTRIGKCTVLFAGNSFWERAIRTHEHHDREHGYRLHVLRQQMMDDVWGKPAYILSILLRELAKPESERLEWLLWVDADTVILNPHIPIDVFLPPPGTEFDDVHLMYSHDWNGLNNGVFPVRVNVWSVQLFSAITSFRHFRPDDPLPFRDQTAMNTLMQEPAFRDNVVQAPQRWFNAYQGEDNETLAPYQIRRGDFLVHFAGVSPREERMGYWLERAEQHLDDWEVPLKSTSYIQEVKDFWAEHSNMRRAKKESLASSRLKAKELMSKLNQRLNDYGDRLGEDQRLRIQQQKDELNKILEDERSASKTTKIEEAVQKLEGLMQPLTSVIAEAHRLLLNSAHEAILAGEKDLLEGGFGDGVQDPELDSISETVKNLKNLVMTPQEHWNRHDITAATNAVTEARAKLQEKAAALRAETQEAQSAAGADTNALPYGTTDPGLVQPVTGPNMTVTGSPVMVWTTATEIVRSSSIPAEMGDMR